MQSHPTQTFASSSILERGYDLDHLLGSGGFGVVIAVTNKLDQQKYAVKLIPNEQRDMKNFKKEVSLLSKLNHPNVVKYVTSWIDQFDRRQLENIFLKIAATKNVRENLTIPERFDYLETICIQMELCGPSLRKWLKKRTLSSYSEKINLAIFDQLCDGLKHIHEHNIIHRDLKPDNILLCTIGGLVPQLKIGDFGYSVVHLDGEYSHTERAGASLYRAPEQFGAKYGRAVDLYAAGLVLYQLYDLSSQNDVGVTLNKLKYNKDASAVKNEQIRRLVLALIELTPEERPSLDSILRALKLMGEEYSQPIGSSSSNSVKAKGKPVGVKHSVENKDDLQSNRGCKHYRRKCKIQCPKENCQRLFWCRLCHDETVKGHKLDRFSVRIVQCVECEQIQVVRRSCNNCNTNFAKYYCGICHFFEDSEEATSLYFHCAECGICRKKAKSQMEYIHCHECEMCIQGTTLSTHACKKTAGRCLCNFCNKEIFSSTEPAMLISCGHYVHESCYMQFPTDVVNCPVCGDW